MGEITWSNRTTLLYPLLCSTAGVAAGLFGVGGGIIKGPLMLELGVMPEVAAATSATMILFTSGAASIVYLHFSYVLPDYGLALFATGFLVTLAGQLLTYKMIKVFRRRSIIIFMMVTLVAASACIMAYQAVDTLVDTAAHPKDLLHLGTICQTAGPDE